MSRATPPVPLTLLAPGWPVMPGDADPDAEPGPGPGGPPPEPAEDALELPRIAWRRGAVEPIEAELLRALGFALPVGAPVPSANAWADDLEGEARAAVEAALADGAHVLRADPVHLSPDRDTALLLAPEALALETREVDALVQALDGFLASDGLRLHAASPERWYLTGPALPDTGAVPPQAASGRRVADLSDATPAASAAADDSPRALRALASELEMLLHSHPVNVARRARGKPAVTGLWFHGPAGAWPAMDGARAPAAALVSDDVFAGAAARAAGVVRIAPDRDLADARGPVVVFDRSVERASLSGNGDAARHALRRLADEWFDRYEVSVHAGDGRTGAPAPVPPAAWWKRTLGAFARWGGR